MSIKDVMMIQDEIEKSALTAGAGDFGRTAFEYSKEFIMKTSDTIASYGHQVCICKVVLPKSGMYKLSGDYNIFRPLDSASSEWVSMESFMMINYDQVFSGTEIFIQTPATARNRLYYITNVSIGGPATAITTFTARPGRGFNLKFSTSPSLAYQHFDTYIEGIEGNWLIIKITASLSDRNETYEMKFKNIKLSY